MPPKMSTVVMHLTPPAVPKLVVVTKYLAPSAVQPKKRGSIPGKKRGPYKKNKVEKMKIFQISIERRRQERGRLRLTVSDKLNEFEQQLIAMQLKSDNLLQFNKIKSKRKTELNRLRVQKRRKERTKEKIRMDNLKKRKIRAGETLRRLFLKKKMTNNLTEMEKEKLDRLSREYEEVCRSIIVATASDTARTNARNNTAIVAAVATVAAAAAVTAPTPTRKQVQLHRRSTTATVLVSGATATVPTSIEPLVCKVPTPPPTEEQNDTDDKTDSISLSYNTSTGRKSMPEHSPVFTVSPRGIGPIPHPNENDILCGRGGRINCQARTVQHRDVIHSKKSGYLDPSTKKLEKAHIAAGIVSGIRTNPMKRMNWEQLQTTTAKEAGVVAIGLPNKIMAEERKTSNYDLSLHNISGNDKSIVCDIFSGGNPETAAAFTTPFAAASDVMINPHEINFTRDISSTPSFSRTSSTTTAACLMGRRFRAKQTPAKIQERQRKDRDGHRLTCSNNAGSVLNIASNTSTNAAVNNSELEINEAYDTNFSIIMKSKIPIASIKPQNNVIVTVEKMEASQRVIERRRWKRDHLRLAVSDKVNELEQELIAMQATPDNIPQYNLIKSLMEKEIKKFQNDKKKIDREKVNRKSQFYRNRRTKSMKQRDNLIRRLRRCELKKREGESEKDALKFYRLSREYEEVCRSIIVETASDTARTNAHSNTTAIVATEVTVVAAAAVTAPTPTRKQDSTTATELVSDTTATVPTSAESVVWKALTPPRTKDQNDTDDKIDSISLGNNPSTGRKSTPKITNDFCNMRRQKKQKLQQQQPTAQEPIGDSDCSTAHVLNVPPRGIGSFTDPNENDEGQLFRLSQWELERRDIQPIPMQMAQQQQQRQQPQQYHPTNTASTITFPAAARNNNSNHMLVSKGSAVNPQPRQYQQKQQKQNIEGYNNRHRVSSSLSCSFLSQGKGTKRIDNTTIDSSNSISTLLKVTASVSQKERQQKVDNVHNDNPLQNVLLLPVTPTLQQQKKQHENTTAHSSSRRNSINNSLHPTDDDDDEDTTVCDWIQCENERCLKWRKVPYCIVETQHFREYSDGKKRFVCSDTNNWTKTITTSCATPEEEWQQEYGLDYVTMVANYDCKRNKYKNDMLMSNEVDNTIRAAPLEIYRGKPTESLADIGLDHWPDGWIKIVMQRQGGKTVGRSDAYWYTPTERFKLRSIIEIKQFLIALRQSNGDEKVAKRIMKKSIDSNKTTKQQRITQKTNFGVQISKISTIGTTKTIATPIIAKDVAADLVKPNLLSDDATVLTKGIQKETIEVIDDENDDKDDVNNEIIEIEESSNENIIELLDDCDNKSDDVGNDDNENRTIVIETFNGNIIDLIDDDDDDSDGDVVENAPAEGKYDDDNEGIEFVGSKGINPLSDFPHSREDCVTNLFRIDPAKFCPQCYCYVCDMNAKDCPKWEDNHCFAQSTDRIWKQRRSAARSKRKSSKEKILYRALRNIGTCMTTDPPSKRRRINVNYRT